MKRYYFEKVTPMHPDKIADRIAGAILDYGFTINSNNTAAIEVLIGHGICTIINETNTQIPESIITDIVKRIAKDEDIIVNYKEVQQDIHLADNNSKKRIGDNGIFHGVKTSKEEQILTDLAATLYAKFKADGKYIITNTDLIICQSNATNEQIMEVVNKYVNYHQLQQKITLNPLGEWTGGINVDAGATNRKLGSDMGRSVTGGGLHGKDLSKGDISVNIFVYNLAQNLKRPFQENDVNTFTAIGDDYITISVDNDANIETTFSNVVKAAKDYIDKVGGYEKFAEWGLIRPKKRRL